MHHESTRSRTARIRELRKLPSIVKQRFSQESYDRLSPNLQPATPINAQASHVPQGSNDEYAGSRSNLVSYPLDVAQDQGSNLADTFGARPNQTNSPDLYGHYAPNSHETRPAYDNLAHPGLLQAQGQAAFDGRGLTTSQQVAAGGGETVPFPQFSPQLGYSSVQNSVPQPWSRNLGLQHPYGTLTGTLTGSNVPLHHHADPTIHCHECMSAIGIRTFCSSCGHRVCQRCIESAQQSFEPSGGLTQDVASYPSGMPVSGQQAGQGQPQLTGHPSPGDWPGEQASQPGYSQPSMGMRGSPTAGGYQTSSSGVTAAARPDDAARSRFVQLSDNIGPDELANPAASQQGPHNQDPRYQDPRRQDPRYPDTRNQHPHDSDPHNPGSRRTSKPAQYSNEPTSAQQSSLREEDNVPEHSQHDNDSPAAERGTNEAAAPTARTRRASSIRNNPFIVADRASKPHLVPLANAHPTGSSKRPGPDGNGTDANVPADSDDNPHAGQSEPVTDTPRRHRKAGKHPQPGTLDKPSAPVDSHSSNDPGQHGRSPQKSEHGPASPISKLSAFGGKGESLWNASYETVAGHIIQHVQDAVSELAKGERQSRDPSARGENRGRDVDPEASASDDLAGSTNSNSKSGSVGDRGKGKGPEKVAEPKSTADPIQSSHHAEENAGESGDDGFHRLSSVSSGATSFSCEEPQTAQPGISGSPDKPAESDDPQGSDISSISEGQPEGSAEQKPRQPQPSDANASLKGIRGPEAKTATAPSGRDEEDGKSARPVDRKASTKRQTHRSDQKSGNEQIGDTDANTKDDDFRRKGHKDGDVPGRDKKRPSRLGVESSDHGKATQRHPTGSQASNQLNTDNEASAASVTAANESLEQTDSSSGAVDSASHPLAANTRREPSDTKSVRSRGTGASKSTRRSHRSTVGPPASGQPAEAEALARQSRPESTSHGRASESRLPKGLHTSGSLAVGQANDHDVHGGQRSKEVTLAESLEAQTAMDPTSGLEEVKTASSGAPHHQRQGRSPGRSSRHSNAYKDVPVEALGRPVDMINDIPEQPEDAASSSGRSQGKGSERRSLRYHPESSSSLRDQYRHGGTESPLTGYGTSQSEGGRRGEHERKTPGSTDKNREKSTANHRAASSKDSNTTRERRNHAVDRLAAIYEADQDASNTRPHGHPTPGEDKSKGTHAPFTSSGRYSTPPGRTEKSHGAYPRTNAGATSNAIPSNAARGHRAAHSEAPIDHACTWRGLYTGLATDLSNILADASQFADAGATHNQRAPFHVTDRYHGSPAHATRGHTIRPTIRPLAYDRATRARSEATCA